MKALTDRQRVALQYIARRPRCTNKELAGEMGISISTAFDYGERLRLNGLVRRPMGTRSFVLTPAGVEAVAGAQKG